MNNKKLLTSYSEFLVIREYSKPDEISERERRLVFLVDDILELTTYCEGYSIKIGETVLDIMKYINSKQDYLTPKSKYDYAREQWELDYSVYVQFIIQYLKWEQVFIVLGLILLKRLKV